MRLNIKNMVCDRCVLVVRQQLERQGLAFEHIQLGEVELAGSPSLQQLSELKDQLELLGFAVLENRKATIVENIKRTIIRSIHGSDKRKVTKKLSVVLEEELQLEYQSLSGLFSAAEGITIAKYVILQRIERAKELLMYDEMSLSEIADTLDYSSVQHLSQQFKQITGLTPSHFKQLSENIRKPLDRL